VGLERENERECVCERKSWCAVIQDKDSVNVCVRERYLVLYETARVFETEI
jgi:hypothetical protein